MQQDTTSLPIPAQSVGVGLKPAHYRDALSIGAAANGAGLHDSPFSFFEVHAENFMGEGGPAHAWLTAIRESFPLSVHGVCLSIGGTTPIDKDHLQRLRSVVERYDPVLVSEHLAWCAHEELFYNDLIAPPMTRDMFNLVCEHIDEVQTALGRRILIENPSQYLKMPSDMSEPAFLNGIAARTGCGLLLDINNVYVSAQNLGFDANAYLDEIDPAHVGEIHLAGHAVDEASGLRIDDHGSSVPDTVGSLYRDFVRLAGARPTLVEWDTDTPPLNELAKEASKARDWMISAEADASAKKRMAGSADV